MAAGASEQNACARVARSAWTSISRTCPTWAAHVYSHKGDTWNEAADVLAKLGCEGGPAIDERELPREKYEFSLCVALFWTDELEKERARGEQLGDAAAEGEGEVKVNEVKFASFNTCTLYPTDESEGAMSTRRIALSLLFSDTMVDIVGLQETRVI